MPQIVFASRTDKSTSRSHTGAELMNCYAQTTPGEGDESKQYVYPCAGAVQVNAEVFAAVQPFAEGLWGVTALGQVFRDAHTSAPIFVTSIPHTGDDWVSCATRGHLVLGAVGAIPSTITAAGVVVPADLDQGVSSVTTVGDAVLYAVAGSDRFWLSDGSNAPSIQNTAFATAQVRADQVRRTVTIGETVLLLGDTTIEQWYVNRDASFPLAPYSNGVAEQGIANKDTFAHAPNVGFWLTRDLQVYAGVGRDSKPVSTRAMHNFLEEHRDAVLGTAYMASYSVSGRWFIVLTVPGLITLEYDMTEGVWHSRSSKDSASWDPRAFWHVGGHTYWHGAKGVMRVTPRDPKEYGLPPWVRMQSQLIGSYESMRDTLDYIMLNFDQVVADVPTSLQVETDMHTVTRNDVTIRHNERYVSRNFGAGRQFRVTLSFYPADWFYLRSAFAQLGAGDYG